MALQNSIYLLQTREFLASSIYKIGKTTKPLLKRFNQYPNGSRLILQMECLDCDNCEKKLLELFRSKYTNKPEYGREYFQGDSISMTRDIFNFIMDEQQLKDKVNVPLFDKPVKVAKPKKISVKAIEGDKLKPQKDNETQNNNYDCKRCGLYFKEKKYLIQHLKKKIYCMAVNGNTIPDILLKEIQFIKKGGIECYKCNKIFNKYYLDKHKCSNKKELEYLKEEIKQIHKILTKPK
jgi:hypothetical protein